MNQDLSRCNVADSGQMAARERVVEHRHCRITYTVRGNGPIVLLVQGAGVYGDGWLPQINALAMLEAEQIAAAPVVGHSLGGFALICRRLAPGTLMAGAVSSRSGCQPDLP